MEMGILAPPNIGITDFCIATGWSVEKHVRFLAILTESGHPDIIGFGDVVVSIIALLILIHGYELGEFRNTDNVDFKVYLILYILCLIGLISLLWIFNIRELPKTLNVKEKILTALMFFVLPLFPMFLLSGIGLYVDYYTTNKQWKVEKVDFINRETYGGGKGGESYTYLVKIADSTFFLESNEYIQVKQELTLKECKTNLGNIIFDRYYDSIPEHNDARQTRKENDF